MTPRARPGSPLGAAPTMALGTALSRLTGFLRIVALAYALGIGPLSDAYNLANNTPNIVYDLVAGGILSATLVPVFVEWMTARSNSGRSGGTGRVSDTEADRAMSAVISVASVVLIVGSLVLVAAAPLVVALYSIGSHAPAISAEKAEAVTLLRWFGPQVAFYGMCTLIGAVLNARRVFAPPMFVPIVNNLVSIVVLFAVAIAFRHPTLFTAHSHAVLTIALGAGTTMGVALQAFALLPALSRSRHQHGETGTVPGSGIHWVWEPRHPAVVQVVRLSGWTFGFVLANQLAYFVVLALATHVGHGAVTAYTYAFTFFQLPFGIVAVSVMGALQPELAEMWTRRDPEGFRRRLAHGLTAIMAVVIPSAAGLIALSQPIVALVLGHGAASAASTVSTGGALAMLALGLPGFSAYLLLVRAFQAIQDTRTVFGLYLLENGINVVLAIALAGPMGVRGLALAMSLAYTLAAFVAAFQLALALGGLGWARTVRPLARVAILSIVTGTITYAVQAHVGSQIGAGLLVKVVTAIAVGVSVFAAGSLGGAAASRNG